MNQNMTPQRPPQGPRQTNRASAGGPAQRAPQRPQGAPRQAPQGARSPQGSNRRSENGFGKLLTGVVIGTVALLVISMIVLCVVLAVGGLDRAPSKDKGDQGGSSKPQSSQTAGTDKPSGSNQGSKPGATISTKTGITLPCETKAETGSYSVGNATDLSGDSRIQSTAAALIDVTGGRTVAAKKGDERVFPASMTKVMTLLVACENAKDPTALLTLTEEMVQKYNRSYTPPEDSPSLATSKWKVGAQVTVEDALYMVIYKSDTYACWLLADYVSGSEEEFVKLMNSRAAELGCRNTNFTNTTGLHDENHYTTCVDMASIMAAAMCNTTAQKVLTSTQLYIMDFYVNGVKSDSDSMYSGWYSARLEKYPYGKAAPYYAGNGSDIRLVAGKTGYESIPKYCFVTAGRNDETGTLFVCVQVGASSAKESTNDSREIYQTYADY